jgi:hypothetical protein
VNPAVVKRPEEFRYHARTHAPTATDTPYFSTGTTIPRRMMF